MVFRVSHIFGVVVPLVLLGLIGVGVSCSAKANDQQIVVFAASSLTDAFSDLRDHFEDENPGVTVAFSFAGSQVLRVQIEQGAPADIFASANSQHIDAVLGQGSGQSSLPFAYNSLVVVVPRDNPAKIHAFSDLVQAERIVIGTAKVPVGRYTRDVLERAGRSYGPSFQNEVMSRVVSEEANVRLVLAKVRLGAADAAFVYRTDVIFDDVIAVEIPAEFNVRAEYQVATVSSGSKTPLSTRWMNFLASAQAQEVLRQHGFSHD